MILVGGLAAALLIVILLFALAGGDEEETGAQPRPAPAPTASPRPSSAPAPDEGRVETFEVFAAKDPFKPLVVEGEGGTGEQSGGAARGADSAGVAATESAPASTGGGGGPRAARPRGARAGERTVEGRRVKLVDVFKRNGRKHAQVRVDTTVYTARPGETFASNFKLVSISGRCASFLYGDDQFTLCEGEEVLK